MSHRIALGLVLVAVLSTTCYSQDWARKMFKTTECDFGSVARGAKAEHRFIFENLYLEDVHIASAYSSCGCTSVRIENSLVKTYEKGAIVAHFNTDTFSGQRGATLTVIIDQPYYAEVQLHDRGYIRSDVTFEPGSVQLGALDQGAGFDQNVTINYNGGNGNWQILGIQSGNPHITALAVQTGRNFGQVSYQLQVHIDKKMPAGYLIDHLILTTNDGQTSKIPVLIEGRVVAGISVSPAALFIGVVQPGQKVTKQLVVTGKKPFRILSISCDDKSFQFDTSKDGNVAQVLHQIPVTFIAGKDTGKVVKTIRIKTDQGEATPELPAYAVVAAATP
jgi:hypothetical protein